MVSQALHSLDCWNWTEWIDCLWCKSSWSQHPTCNHSHCLLTVVWTSHYYFAILSAIISADILLLFWLLSASNMWSTILPSNISANTNYYFDCVWYTADHHCPSGKGEMVMGQEEHAVCMKMCLSLGEPCCGCYVLLFMCTAWDMFSYTYWGGRVESIHFVFKLFIMGITLFWVLLCCFFSLFFFHYFPLFFFFFFFLEFEQNSLACLRMSGLKSILILWSCVQQKVDLKDMDNHWTNSVMDHVLFCF